jgi:NADH dehydrogenase FAD-containing subunit
MTRVVVVGAGFAGYHATRRMRRHPDLDVTVLDPTDSFPYRTRRRGHRLGRGGRRAADVGTARWLTTVGPARV